tara:strand:- start:70 stop:1563 length:1494 start_codon:yes stop_codon:yes gene_type:complete
MKKRIMVDMSATLLHYGHIRLLMKASNYGTVVVGLTTDDEILSNKGYQPELNFDQRKEILESIKFVNHVVPVPWLINDSILDQHNIDLLIHGDDNSNLVDKKRLLILPRTKGVSSKEIRKKSSLITNDIKRNILLNPGPATTTNSVKMSQVVPDICPRESDFGKIMASVSEDLTSIVADNDSYSTVLFCGSGTAAVESILTSVIEKDRYVLIVNNGAYGKRMCEIASRYEINFIEYNSSATEPINISDLEKLLKNNNSISYLAVVHNETTTGLLNDLNQLGNLAKKYNLKLIVDAMFSFGAIPINMKKQNISYLCSSSNKNIQGMAGISYVIAEKKSFENLKNIKPLNYYLNLYEQYNYFKKNNQMRFTPPVQTIYSLKQAILELKQEGIRNRYSRYANSWIIFTDALKEMNLKYLVNDDYHSKLITSVIIPENINFDDMHDYFYEKGYTIYPSKIEDLNSFRVANIGEINSNDMLKFVTLLKEYFTNLNIFKYKKY